ncbi:MAG: TetR/AcrR family transcriptional regulator [Acidimicrobiales bacterium]
MDREIAMARREPKVRETRKKLMAAALEVFCEKGFAATSVDDIAERAGTTRGAFYYYFESKEDIARDLQRDLWHRLAERAQDAFDADLDTITNLKRAFDLHLQAIEELGEARFFLREGWIDPTLEAAGRGEQEWGADLVRDFLADAIAKGEVVKLDPDALAAVITGLFEEATLHVLRSGDVTSTIDVVHRLLDGLSARLPHRGQPRKRDGVVNSTEAVVR